MLGTVKHTENRNSVQDPLKALLLNHEGKGVQSDQTAEQEAGIAKEVVCCCLVVSEETLLHAVDIKASHGPEN